MSALLYTMVCDTCHPPSGIVPKKEQEFKYYFLMMPNIDLGKNTWDVMINDTLESAKRLKMQQNPGINCAIREIFCTEKFSDKQWIVAAFEKDYIIDSIHKNYQIQICRLGNIVI